MSVIITLTKIGDRGSSSTDKAEAEAEAEKDMAETGETVTA